MSEVTQEYKEKLARQIYAVHGPNLIPPIRELHERLDCTLKEAKELIEWAKTHPTLGLDSEQPISNPLVCHIPWDSKKAEKWLRKEATALSTQARYIRDNAHECSSDEDEFRCWLSNGMGIDDETEQNEIIAEIHGDGK